ncbi:MAG: COX15/CtaA family protein [Pyrinomonadaceae bacterium]
MKFNRVAVFAWGVVAWNLLVIVWGAYVRASVSGDGCGSHWPLCNGEVIPTTGLTKTLVELTHRLTSGVALILVIALVVRARRAFPAGHRVRAGAWVTLAFILIEALLGAALVKFELVAGNASMARAFVMSVHLVNTFLLLAAMSLTAWWASGGPPLKVRGQGAAFVLLILGFFGTLLLAVSGAVAALGDTLFPARSLTEAFRQDLSPGAHVLLRLRLIHPGLAVLVGAYVLLMASYVSNFLRPGPRTKKASSILIGLVLTQFAAGLLNVALLAPIWLQLVHLLLADLLWIALTLFAATALAEPIADWDQRIADSEELRSKADDGREAVFPSSTPAVSDQSAIRWSQSAIEDSAIRNRRIR